MQNLNKRIAELESQANRYRYTNSQIVVTLPGESNADALKRLGIDEGTRAVFVIPGKRTSSTTQEGHDDNH